MSDIFTINVDFTKLSLHLYNFDNLIVLNLLIFFSFLNLNCVVVKCLRLIFTCIIILYWNCLSECIQVKMVRKEHDLIWLCKKTKPTNHHDVDFLKKKKSYISIYTKDVDFMKKKEVTQVSIQKICQAFFVFFFFDHK